MTYNKIIIKVIGRTFILPTEAVFSFNNTVLDVNAPNFLHKFNKRDIQDIFLLDPDSENQSDFHLVELLRHKYLGKDPQELNRTTKPFVDRGSKGEGEEKKEKKEVKLTSGMI